MPARICPDCGRPHNHTAYRCTTCYQSGAARVRRRQPRAPGPGPRAPGPCGDGLCGNPATQARLVTVGDPSWGVTRDSGWLFLCPACAALFDEIEAQPIMPSIIPSIAAARGHIYC